MSEFLPKEKTPERVHFDKGAVLDKLFEIADEFGLDVIEEDVEWLREETYAGEDETEFLEWLVSLAAQSGVDYEELLTRLGIPLESVVENDEQTE